MRATCTLCVGSNETYKQIAEKLEIVPGDLMELNRVCTKRACFCIDANIISEDITVAI